MLVRPIALPPDAGLLVRDGPAPDLEARQWEGAQRARHPAAPLAVYPNAHADREHLTPPNLLGRCQTSTAAPSGRRHGGPQ
jgi:hypothetical protein